MNHAAARLQPGNPAAMQPVLPLVRPELEPLLGLLFMMMEEMRSVIVHFTAASSGAGATTVARQVAAAAAATAWCKVALLDARSDGTRAGPGLIDQFERGDEPALRDSSVQGAALATGTLGGSYRAPGRKEAIRGLYGLLRASHTLIVVDCAPVFAGQQAAVLAGAADGVVLVIEAERTRVDEAARAREMLEQLGAAILGLVLNKRRQRIPRFLGKLL